MSATLDELAGKALALLARVDGGPREWRTSVRGADGIEIAIVLTGPDVPRTVPGAIATPDRIARERPWVGTYRLVVRAPLIVFDLYWNKDEPLRIMGFSRGDWEQTLIAAR